MRTVSVLNHKGGVGKTTFTGCTAQALALSGFRVLVVDNDSQHNLSAMFGCSVQTPNIRDVYRSNGKDALHLFLKAIRKTEIDDLHVITASNMLSESDIHDLTHLKKCLVSCRLERFYDYLLIDNAPGMDRLQAVSIHASDEIFVPTELKQFAVDGIVEIEKILHYRFPECGGISKIIPNFYKNVKRQNTYIAALNTLFPGKVTKTAIPADSVFDELITEGKILFLHRLYSKGAAYYLKIMHELINLSEDDVWERMLEKRNRRLSEEARERFYKRRAEKTELNEHLTSPVL
jgi:chromosome partitioning protein